MGFCFWTGPHLFLEIGAGPLIEMKIVGHTDYKTTANIYTHVRDEMLKKATVNMGEVFGSREEGLNRRNSGRVHGFCLFKRRMNNCILVKL